MNQSNTQNSDGIAICFCFYSFSELMFLCTFCSLQNIRSATSLHLAIWNHILFFSMYFQPENILMKSADPNCWDIKITDFGLSRFMSERQLLTTMCGTPMFLAPEVLHSKRYGGYDLAVDYWSLGVILYLMLVGHPPYNDKKDGNLLHLVKNGKFSFPERSWQRVSADSKDLVQHLMCLNVEQRYNGPQVLAHRWMRGGGNSLSNTHSNRSNGSQKPQWSGKKRRRLEADDDCKERSNGTMNRNHNVNRNVNHNMNRNGNHNGISNENHNDLEGVPPRKRYRTNNRNERMSCDSMVGLNPMRLDSGMPLQNGPGMCSQTLFLFLLIENGDFYLLFCWDSKGKI